jgi:hypothetical protein
MRPARSGPRAMLILAIALLATGRARAGTEEFSTFSITSQQEDDESLLDHLLTRPSRAWREEWERASQALRSSQGCLTSGQWTIDTRLKLRAPLGDRATFGLDVRDEQTDVLMVQYFDFSARFPTRAGTPGAFFRPLFDKSRQDLGLFWEFGAETSSAVARVSFTFEDVFNSLWSFRQSRVGEASEPYERHPYEPALWMRVKGSNARAELGGQWLTPSRTRFQSYSALPEAHATLWGALGYGSLEAWRGPMGLEVTGSNRQALSREAPPGSSLYGGDFRRQWSVESALLGSLGAAVQAEARWVYRESSEDSDDPYPERRLDVIDRVLQLEVRARRSRFEARVGGLHDRIMVAAGGLGGSVYPTRIESRAYVGIAARFGKVSLDVVEGLELDPEPYDVWGIHDKGFAHLQTTF